MSSGACRGIFFGGGQKEVARPEGPIIRAEARRAKAAGDGFWGRKIFDFLTTLDAFSEHFQTIL